ncbi:import component protein [Mucilaginibacter pedocola]|uniref:Import component protein n=1 Tax=Mucilaginibacter pedocola TaxID=1792845 RepID=A0A1S9PET8_9SPHI|nr:import component protein [Mucilaginibacter pedocola]OOQ59419.1 import component protein [Mucilaginibacter pedocola]
MTNKGLAIVAYITIIGWVVSYLEFKKRADKSALVNYHLGQSLGLIIVSFALGIAISVLAAIIPSLYFVSFIISGATLVLLLLGVVTANNEAMKPLPIIGKFFEGRFNFDGRIDAAKQ